MIRAIVFDFDGLILDTEEAVYLSWLEVYQAHGEDLPFERWVQIVGSTTAGFHPQDHLEERLGRSLPQEVLDRRIGRRTEMILAQDVLPGVVRHLEEAKAMDLKVGLASSSTSDWVKGHLARLDILQSFDCLRCVAIPNSITASLDLGQADLVLGSLAEVTLDGLLRKLAPL